MKKSIKRNVLNDTLRWKKYHNNFSNDDKAP